MKDFKLITSVLSALALVACGGGSGGTPELRQVITPDSQAAQSNAAVTSMASEILVAKDGSVVTPALGRSGSANYNGKTYTSYRLDDVDFKIGGEDSKLKFEVDSKGQIIALTKLDRSDDFSGDHPTYDKSQEGTFTRISSTGKDFAKDLFIYGCRFNTSEDGSVAAEHFDGNFEIMADTDNLSASEVRAKLLASIDKEINKIKESQPDRNNDAALEAARAYYKDQVNNMNSFDAPEKVHANVRAESVDIGLKYADLGFAELTVTDPNSSDTLEHSYSPYVGGYGVLKVSPEKLSEDATFTGTAIAGLEYKQQRGDNETKKGVLVRQDNAILTMHTNGSSELEMNNLKVVNTGNDEAGLMGKKWYDVTVRQNADNKNPTFIVNGTNQITGYDLPSGATPSEGITFNNDEWRPTEQEYTRNIGNTPGTGTRYGGSAEAFMYGPNSNAEEATARFGFSNEEYSNGNADHDSVAIYGAFGGKKQ